MQRKAIFLSHIHEEKDLALLIQEAITDEFSGTVDVFVSSDGTSIPAGANFLKKIEDGLINCVAAIYLISNSSVKRNWINFELGAIWIRNLIETNDGKNPIPLIPICHSGISPGTLPPPLNNLNAILGCEASQLEFAFKSIQPVVGGRGKLRTDFDDLAHKIIRLEQRYTLDSKVAQIIKLLIPPSEFSSLIQHCEALDYKTQELCIPFEQIEQSKVRTLKELIKTESGPIMRIETLATGFGLGPTGSISYESINLHLSPKLITDARNIILKK